MIVIHALYGMGIYTAQFTLTVVTSIDADRQHHRIKLAN
jgi:hypothetical protein